VVGTTDPGQEEESYISSARGEIKEAHKRLLLFRNLAVDIGFGRNERDNEAGRLAGFDRRE
jgi:hypothetical protein